MYTHFPNNSDNDILKALNKTYFVTLILIAWEMNP